MSAADLGVSPTDSTSSIEINDAIFCEHGKEVCDPCGLDSREENDAFYGFDPVDRDQLSLPAYNKNIKDGSIQCKKHSSATCTTCFGWKKQLTKLHADSKKHKKKAAKEPKSNLHV